MLDLTSKFWKLLLVPLFAGAFFLGAYFFFYRGGYNPPPAVDLGLENAPPPASSFSSLDIEIPSIRRGTLVVDTAHNNDFVAGEMATLLDRVSSRGYDVTFMGGFNRLEPPIRLAMLEENLRRADSFIVALPVEPYDSQEVDLVEQYVRKGGKLLLIADPGRRHRLNSLGERFGVAFQPDYLYNLTDYDLNFQDVFIRNFRSDELTRGLGQVALYTAGSIKTSGTGLAWTDGITRSSMVQRIEPFYPIARGDSANVLAIADMTFMVPPQNSILDNDKLVSNLADYLTASGREFHLADFPHFFKDGPDILLGRSELFGVATQLKNVLSGLQVNAEIQGVENPTRDTVYLGLYEDAPDVAQYLDIAGLRVEAAISTPFTSDIPTADTGIMLLYEGQGRHVLVILGHSADVLSNLVGRLGSREFTQGLVSDFAGVYRTP